MASFSARASFYGVMGVRHDAMTSAENVADCNVVPYRVAPNLAARRGLRKPVPSAVTSARPHASSVTLVIAHDMSINSAGQQLPLC